MDVFKQLPLSPGLKTAIEKIEKLEIEGKPDEAFNEILASLAQIRISDALLRFKLAKACNKKGDTISAKALFEIAIKHLRKEDPLELQIIDAIKTEMA